MKRLSLFLAVLGGSTALASAADLYSPPPYEPPVTYEPSTFNWTGIYAGIHGGFGGDRFEYPYQILDLFDFQDFSVDLNGEPSLTSSGFFAGGQIGANWQIAPQWVIGIEGDASWSNIKGEIGLDANIANEDGNLGIAATAGSKVDWFGTIRGRVGFLPTQRLMVYGTGGAAVGRTETYVNGSIYGTIDDEPFSIGGGASTSDTNWGWTAGGGFEYAVTDNITLKTEYLYVDLGTSTLAGDGDAGISVDTHFHTIKAGLNFLLGNGGGSGADLPYYAPVETVAEPFDWTGIYAGLMGGYAGDRFEYPYQILELFEIEDEPVDLFGSPHLTSSGFFAGGQIGANWQFAPQWVLGVEGDAAWSDIKGEVTLDATLSSLAGSLGGSIEAGSKVNWFGTIRGRLGFLPTPRLMLYGTGGAAVGETESYANGQISGVGPVEIDESFGVSTSDTNWGWTAGGGFEYAITDNVTLKTEYLYVDLGSSTLAGDSDAGISVDTHFHTVKAGLNFLFN